MTELFAFESDFVASLRCIPMAVRFKLDRVAIKLTLRQWSRFTREDRQTLLDTRCVTDAEARTYRAMLALLVQARAGETARRLEEPPPMGWCDAVVPDQVRGFAAGLGIDPPSAEAWAALPELRRFVLVKLSRDNHDNVNFVPALREFGLI